MARRKKRKYRRRRKSLLRPKKGTIFSILSLLIFLVSVLLFLSFFQTSSPLSYLNLYTDQYFGVMKFLLPVVLVTLSLFLTNLKVIKLRPYVTIGSWLIFVCLLGLSQSGMIGFYIWFNLSETLTSFGSFILLAVMLFIGLIVLFNTSFEEIAKAAESLYASFADTIGPAVKSKKSAFVEKLPMKTPPIKKAKETQPTDKKEAAKGKSQAQSTLPELGTTLISNLPATDQVWEYPPLSLLSDTLGKKADRGDMKQNADVIEKTLDSFGITAKVAEVNEGPAVTQYALQITMGTKLSKITALSNDLALALAAPTGQIRIEAPIPGRHLVGVEVPNRSLEYVTLKQMLSYDTMKRGKDKLSVALGLDVTGRPVKANIAKMPHVLVAGTTGSGKSVLINAWIASILFRTTPAEVKLILVDPKRVELTLYNDIPHLLTPVITEHNQILSSLKWAIKEMERRYKLFQTVQVRNIDGYNDQSGFQSLPYILIFIDELSDLMSYAPVEVEESLCRLAQMARATGIHLVVATQRPSVDVITGLIKANFPARVAFNVSSMMDSRVVLDLPGAEKLLGRGDMLYIPPDQAKPRRIQGTFVTEEEIRRVIGFIKKQSVPIEYTKEVTTQEVSVKKGAGGTSIGESERDELFGDAIRVVCQYDRASASLLQRRLKVGYARAARIIDELEEEGVIGPGEGAKPRDVLIKNPEEYLSGRENKSQETETAAPQL